MIKLDHVEKYYNRGRSNEIHVINDATLELPDRGMVAIFGRSGCGKTTLLNVIGGLDDYIKGSISIDGNDLSKKTDLIRNLYVGYIFQNYNLNKEETVFDNVADALKLCGVNDKNEIEERVAAALAAVDMSRYTGRTPDTLSGGQQQRVAIARAIVKDPRVILADEPTGNLDEANTVMIMDLLHAIAKDHLVILVTHEENLVDHYCDTVIELSDGKIVGSRTNEVSDNYSVKDKNVIYLGEYDCANVKSDFVSVDYYGEKPAAPIKLRIVNANGKSYLEIDSDSVRFLDEKSEIKLKNGVFEDKKKPADISSPVAALPPLKNRDNRHIGRLFDFKSSVVSGYGSIFKKKKKSWKLLRTVMVLFAVVFTFMTAYFATGFRTIIETWKNIDQNVFYLKAKETDDYDLTIGSNGIDGVSLVTQDQILYPNSDLIVFMGNFETMRLTNQMTFNAIYLDASVAAGMRSVVGKKTPGQNEVVITTALADWIISMLHVSYMSGYADVLNVEIKDTRPYVYYDVEKNDYSKPIYDKKKIVGVIRSDEKAIFYPSAEYATMNFFKMNNAVVASSFLSDVNGFEIPEIPLGTALYVRCADLKKVDENFGGEYYDGQSEGSALNQSDDIDSVIIKGKTFNVLNVDLTENVAASQNLTVKLANLRDRYYNSANNNFFIINDEDASGLYSVCDKTDSVALLSQRFIRVKYYCIHSSDPRTTEKYLKRKIADYEAPNVYTPQFFYDMQIGDTMPGIVSALISLAALFIVMVLCMYFIMRASLMSRIKEIGVYRAIGAKKSNIVFRFFVESLVLITLTVFIGYLFSSLFLSIVEIVSVFGSVFYYPFWLAAIVFVLLYGVCSLCGILPVLRLLRKTPSEILSKYDV